MVVRFVAAMMLLLAVVALPSLARPDCAAQEPPAVVSVGGAGRTAPAAVPVTVEAALTSADPRAVVRAAVAMTARGLALEAVQIEPELPRKILVALADRRLQGDEALAVSALVGLGRTGEMAARTMAEHGDDLERGAARLVMDEFRAARGETAFEAPAPSREE